MPRLLRLALSTFCLLLLALAWLTPASARAEISLNLKPDDDRVRATERLHDFLDEIGYSVEYTDEDKDSLTIHQQQHKIHATLYINEHELPILLLTVHYDFNRKSGTPESRSLAATEINLEQAAIKVCVDEEEGDFYFEYALPFPSQLHAHTIKRFADQTVARSHAMIAYNKTIKEAFYGDEDASPDSAKNADETDEGSDDDPAMTDKDDAQAGKADAADAKPSEPSAPALQPTAPEAPAASATPDAKPASKPQSLVPELPPTTPAAPARTKKAKA